MACLPLRLRASWHQLCSCHGDSGLANARSGWTDTTATLSLESHLIEELLPEMETRFKVRSHPHSRLICGHSLGGFGAINIAFHHPQPFACCAAWSPAALKNEMKQPAVDEKTPEPLVDWAPELATITPREVDLRLWGPLPDGMSHRCLNSPWRYLDEMP